jgi:hypothetical protein
LARPVAVYAIFSLLGFAPHATPAAISTVTIDAQSGTPRRFTLRRYTQTYRLAMSETVRHSSEIRARRLDASKRYRGPTSS